MGRSGEVFEIVVSWVVTTALLFGIVLFDERRLSAARLARAWPPSSRDAAIVAFGPLALPFHFARTRGTFTSLGGAAAWVLGFLGGWVIAVVVVVVSAFVTGALAHLAGFS